jgi:hypothetical protein
VLVGQDFANALGERSSSRIDRMSSAKASQWLQRQDGGQSRRLPAADGRPLTSSVQTGARLGKCRCFSATTQGPERKALEITVGGKSGKAVTSGCFSFRSLWLLWVPAGMEAGNRAAISCWPLAGSTHCESLRAECDMWKQSYPQHVGEYRADERRDAAARRRFLCATRRVAGHARAPLRARRSPRTMVRVNGLSNGWDLVQLQTGKSS